MDKKEQIKKQATAHMPNKTPEIKEEGKEAAPKASRPTPTALAATLADEIAKTVIRRLPHLLATRGEKKKVKKKAHLVEQGLFLDTSAIIDGRVFDIAGLGVLNGVFVVPESILLELKHIADSQDMVKRERGRGGLDALDKLKKTKKMKVIVLPREEQKTENKKHLLDARMPAGQGRQGKEVDEQLIDIAKKHKGKIFTCDYNLEKKASIHGVVTINMNALAQCMKISAVPGEALHIKILHPGKDPTQGVGYLDDGTMLVVEQGSDDVGKMIDVVVSRVIQTVSGRILFAKKF